MWRRPFHCRRDQGWMDRVIGEGTYYILYTSKIYIYPGVVAGFEMLLQTEASPKEHDIPSRSRRMNGDSRDEGARHSTCDQGD